MLTPSSLERCDEPGDWFRREIETALETKRNIIPILFEGFDFNTPKIANQLTGKLAALKKYNALTIPPMFFMEAMDRLRKRWLNVPLAAILHPASVPARQAVKEQKVVADTQPAVTEEQLTTQPWFERSVLRVFLCHASEDKLAVRDLYQKLLTSGFAPWLDDENILPGHDWDNEIIKAVRSCHAVLVCLSNSVANKTGYIQKEMRMVLDIADKQPEDAIFLIPVKLEECTVPNRLHRWQWVNLFDTRGFERLTLSLKNRASTLRIKVE